MSVASSLADLAVAHGQRGAVVVDHQPVHLVAGTLVTDVVAAQLPEYFQLFAGRLDRLLEHDPGDRLEERGRRQRAQVGPVGLALGQQRGGIQSARNSHAIVLVRHELQKLHYIVQALVVFAALRRE